jgi:hypothetical protein
MTDGLAEYMKGEMGDYFDWDGNPITLWEWAALHDQERHVGNTQVGPYWVSTVYLGLNHNWGDGPILIYETMVFRCNRLNPEDGLGDEQDMERYTTREQAEHGHAEMVAKWAAAAPLKELGP